MADRNFRRGQTLVVSGATSAIGSIAVLVGLALVPNTWSPWSESKASLNSGFVVFRGPLVGSAPTR